MFYANGWSYHGTAKPSVENYDGHLNERYSELRTSDRFDDPLAYPGFGLGENMIFPKYELKLYFLVEHNF